MNLAYNGSGIVYTGEIILVPLGKHYVKCIVYNGWYCPWQKKMSSVRIPSIVFISMTLRWVIPKLASLVLVSCMLCHKAS